MRDAGLAAVALIGLAAAPLSAQEPDWYEVTARRQTDGVRALKADIHYAVGELKVFPAREGLLYDTRLRYDAGRFEPDRSWSVVDDVGTLRLGFAGRGEGVDWKAWREVGDDDLGFLSVGLGRDVVTELTVEIGAAIGRLDLGGIPLSRLEYKTGASETEIAFAELNPVRMEEMELAAGAAEFHASGLGNARFDRLSFEGAVGEITLDFTGAWDGDATASISVGLGGLELRLPRDLGVRVRKSGLLASFDSEGFTKVDDAFQTSNWDSARHRLDIELNTVLGAIDVEFVR